MRKIGVSLILTLVLAGFAGAQDGYDDFSKGLRNMNAWATANRAEFSAQVSLEFGIGKPKLDQLQAQFAMSFADAFMTLEIAKLSGKPVDVVAQGFASGKGKGWGFIAKQMGIKPGSAEFKALKERLDRGFGKQKNNSRQADEGDSRPGGNGKPKK